MTSKNPDESTSSDNAPEARSSKEQSPETIAEAAIKSAKANGRAAADAEDSHPAWANGGADNSSAVDAEAKASVDDTKGKDAGDQSDEQGSADAIDAAADPLGFDNARMPDSDSDEEAVDLSEEAPVLTAEESLQQQLADANAKADEHWNRILRMQADLENERKRTQKQVANAHKFAIEGFVQELLPIKDSLEMGLQAAKADDADLTKIVEGSELTLKLLTQAFEKNQISEVDPMDEKFDPNVHQAMSMQESEGNEPNIVIGVMQKGYTLNDRLIRPALVTVSK